MGPRFERAVERLRQCMAEGLSGEFVVNLRQGRIQHLWVNSVDFLQDAPDTGAEDEEGRAKKT